MAQQFLSNCARRDLNRRLPVTAILLRHSDSVSRFPMLVTGRPQVAPGTANDQPPSIVVISTRVFVPGPQSVATAGMVTATPHRTIILAGLRSVRPLRGVFRIQSHVFRCQIRCPEPRIV